ncbi:MAG TPA: hypothetical protein VEQ87_01580 [Burkholderiales bacterium]|nr:hypothetical protein [Burkholderiales bacterium]
MRRFALCLLSAALVVGCATDDQKRNAINDVNSEFRVQYERILAELGTRVYRTNLDDAFPALRSALGRVGMRVGDQSPRMGYLSVVGPAPAPLTDAEWRSAAERDLPKLREIATQHVGVLGRFVSFEPEGLEVIINATALEVRNGVEISLTARMREIAPPKSGMPRREYLPPSAVRMGLEKIWNEFERELRSARTL